MEPHRNSDESNTQDSVISAEPDAPSFVDLPPEQVLDVFERLDIRYQFEMAFTCKTWYILLIPYIIKTEWKDWTDYFMDGGPMAETWASDFLGADRFRLLTSLRVILETTYCFRLFASCSMPNVTILEVEELELDAYNPPGCVFEAIVKGCPKLTKTIRYLRTENNVAAIQYCIEQFKMIPDAFLETVHEVGFRSCVLLLGLVGRSSFKPTVVGSGYWDNVERPLNDKEALIIWKDLLRKEGLEKFEIYDFPTKPLLRGLPPNLKEITSIKPSGLPAKSRDRLREIIRGHKFDLKVTVNSCWHRHWYREDYSASELVENAEHFVDEVEFWASFEDTTLFCPWYSSRNLSKSQFIRGIAREARFEE